MIRGFLVLPVLVLSSLVAFAQVRNPGGMGGNNPSTPSAGPTRDSAASDTGSQGPMEVKSINQLLHDYPKLAGSLQSMLPSDLTPQQACSGFKTLEQCVTTIHVAQNLKLSFPDLKGKTTGKGSINLQKAVEQMAAGVDAKDELKKAKKQASNDMKGVSLFG